MHNPNCDGSHCSRSEGEVRVLPLNVNHSSNLILCRSCFEHELDGRINEAMKYEAICDSIYQSLPDWAKGW